jgi:predicted transcriptional regulator
VPHLGELERAVMAALWSAAGPLTARAVLDALGDRGLAVTTVLTVLSRLERKGLVVRHRDDRAHTYAPAASREEHVAELMREALGTAEDQGAALTRFVSAATQEEIDVLRRALRTWRQR